jgi:hypothetical protein
LSDVERHELTEAAALRMELMQRTTSKRGHVHASAEFLNNDSAQASSGVIASANETSTYATQDSPLLDEESFAEHQEEKKLQAQEAAAAVAENRLIWGSYYLSTSGLFERVWSQICKANDFKCMYSFEFDEVSVNDRFQHKCVVMVRHPYERIMTGMRYHSETTEQNGTADQMFNGSSYQEVLKGLETTEEKIQFEMHHSGKTTINAMYRDMKINMTDSLFVHFEDVGCEEGRKRMAGQIAAHLSLNALAVEGVLNDIWTTDPHRMIENASWTFPSYFTARNYADAKRMFPSDLLETLGYAGYPPDQQYCR